MKKVEELIKQATEVEHSHGAFGEYEKFYRLNPEKLVELVVQECVDALGAYNDYCTYEKQMDMLARHFGIEK